MNNNEIKKALYKEKPNAIRTDRQTSENTLTTVEPYDRYVCYLKSGHTVVFIIPHKEQGEKLFERTEKAQLLIRWIA